MESPGGDPDRYTNLAAVVTRAFFYKPRFVDANLRVGRIGDHLTFWLAGLGITAASFALFTVLGGIAWDFSGQVFIDQLARQFAATAQDMAASLPRGFSPRSMLVIFFVGGLTIFNILPGIATGFGEQFGARGFMFPLERWADTGRTEGPAWVSELQLLW